MTTRLLVIPDTDGELPALLGRIDGVLLSLCEDEGGDVYDVHLRRLARLIGWGRVASLGPLLPDGRELGPVAIVEVDTDVLAQGLVALGALARTDVSTLADYDQRPDELEAGCHRVIHLLSFDGGHDAEQLRAVLGAPDQAQLSGDEYAAYRRLSLGHLRAWAPGDVFARFAMLGS